MAGKSSIKFNAGDKVKISANDKSYEGIVMPQESNSSVFLKLKTGYNVGINLTNVTEVKILEKARPKPEKKLESIKKDKNKKTIAVLHTGGTIASKIDYESGGVTAKFDVEDLLNLVPELKEIANIETNQVANIMSENIRFSFYKTLADAVKKYIDIGNNKRSVDGIIIGHGTDTLQFTAAALSFMFNNLPIPVLLVGSQRSTDRGSTDARINLIGAAKFIDKTDFKGVAICMHESTNDEYCAILSGTKTKKFHTSRRDAFKTVNDTPIARVHIKSGKIEYLNENYSKLTSGKLESKDKFEEKVGICQVYPNMLPEVFDFYREKKYKGLVIEGTGLGHMPMLTGKNLTGKNKAGREDILDALKKLIDSGCVCVMTSQAVFGKVMMDVYTNLRKLKDAGVVSGEDMLTETAFIKLAWLLGNCPNKTEKDREEIKRLVTENLRGEINNRILVDGYL